MPVENGNDPFTGLPWWVKAIVIVGVPSAISIGLVWSNQMQLAGTVRANETRLMRMEMGADVHDKRVTARFEDLSHTTIETNRLLLAGCLNDASKILLVDLQELARDRCVGRR